jgi:hypothetical protein
MPRNILPIPVESLIKVTPILLSLTLVITLTVYAHAWHGLVGESGTGIASCAALTDVPVQQEAYALTQIDSAHLTLRQTGFEPSEIMLPGRPFLLAVDNKTGSGDVVLRLTHESGRHLREVAMPLNKARWREVITLPPGNYNLGEVRHPDWVCRITVRER